MACGFPPSILLLTSPSTNILFENVIVQPKDWTQRCPPIRRRAVSMPHMREKLKLNSNMFGLCNWLCNLLYKQNHENCFIISYSPVRILKSLRDSAKWLVFSCCSQPCLDPKHRGPFQTSYLWCIHDYLCP